MEAPSLDYIDYTVTFILATIIAFSATPIAKKIALHLNAIDIPKDDRRMHNKPIASLGGIAIVLGFTMSLFYLIMSYSVGEGGLFASNMQLAGIMIGALIIVITGVLDDTKGMTPWSKFLMQLLATLSVVMIAGMRIEVFTNPFNELGYSMLPPYISYPFTILWIIGIINAINLIDGLDGLAAGITSISCISLFFINLLINGGQDFSPLVAVLTLALAGSALGFLPFNFYPSKIFMGDTGAYFLGYILGIVSIQGALKSYTAISISIPVIVLALPLLDTLTSIVRRLFSKKPIMQADRGHLHHRLIDMGLSHMQSVIVMYTASAAFGLSAIVMAVKGALSAVVLLILASVSVVGGTLFMKELNEENNHEEINKASKERIYKKIPADNPE